MGKFDRLFNNNGPDKIQELEKTPQEIMDEEVFNKQYDDTLPSFDLEGFLQGNTVGNIQKAKNQARAIELQKYGTDPSNLNAMLDSSFNTDSPQNMSVGNASIPDLPQQPLPNIPDENSFLNKITGLNKIGMGFNDLQPMSSNSPMDVNPDLPQQPPINPKIVEALKAKKRQPASVGESAPTAPPPPSTPPAPDEEVAQRVNPWVAFAAGLGDNIAGRQSNFDWATEANRGWVKDLADRRAGKLNAQKNLDQQTQQDIDNKFREKQLREQISARRDIATMANNSRLDTRAEKQNTALEKKKATLNEVEDRKQNIMQNLDNVDAQIRDKGTFELFGPENQNLDRAVDQIATDMAKLMDPNSVARPGEVELVKKNLIQSGFTNSNETARAILKKFKSEIESRANTAYRVRGLEAPQTTSAETKSVNGKTYTKVPGGWSEQ